MDGGFTLARVNLATLQIELRQTSGTARKPTKT